MTARLASSFRDPTGFVFTHEGVLYRQINASFAADFQLVSSSGLLQELVEAGLLVSHIEVSAASVGVEPSHKILRPDRIPFISYPYEWSFSQLKDAALLTLEIQRRALARGMTLRDATAFNVQFVGSAPIFIDTLSFGPVKSDSPWLAYRQFCQHFVCPLLLAAHRDVRLMSLNARFLDGIPLDLTSRTLPVSSWLRFGSALHVHLHSRSQRRFRNTALRSSGRSQTMSGRAQLGLLDSLQSCIEGAQWDGSSTEWADYVSQNSYSEGAMAHKERLVTEMIAQSKPKMIWDLGANTGAFSRLAAQGGASVVALDSDVGAVDTHYKELRGRRDKSVLPLVCDLVNPTPALGWAGTERHSLQERGPADLLLALALIHHLAIGNNIPLDNVAATFSRLARSLIIEFVPKSDSQTARLLGSREDIFPDYSQAGFEAAFRRHYRIETQSTITDTERVLYRMERLA